MGYVNPILRYGLDRFCADAAAAGVVGLIVPDLPVEESGELQGCCHAHGMHLVYLLAPTSTEARIASVAARATGFIYCMAVAGVTGARADLASDLGAFLARVRAHTVLPLVVGFGISRPEHLERLHGVADDSWATWTLGWVSARTCRFRFARCERRKRCHRASLLDESTSLAL
jgi:tryptophan synthase alpha chain